MEASLKIIEKILEGLFLKDSEKNFCKWFLEECLEFFFLIPYGISEAISEEHSEGIVQEFARIMCEAFLGAIPQENFGGVSDVIFEEISEEFHQALKKFL